MNPNQDGKITRGDWALYGVLIAVFVVGTIYALTNPASPEFALTTKDKGFGFFPLGVSRPWHTLGVILGAGLTLAFYSFLYKDNPFFKAAEHLYVGVGLGYLIVLSWFQYLKGELYVPLLKYWVRPETPGRPDMVLVIPMVLGVFLLARIIRPLAWMSRWAFAFIVGYGAGVAIPVFIQANILKQLQFTVLPLDFGDPFGAFNALVILVGVVSVLIYFYFSMEHKGVVGVTSKVGMWFLMVCFGASFGYTVMGRMALLVGRVTFLVKDWLQTTIG